MNFIKISFTLKEGARHDTTKKAKPLTTSLPLMQLETPGTAKKFLYSPLNIYAHCAHLLIIPETMPAY